MLFLVVEVTRLLSNLIKSGFVAFSQNNKLVINANENKIIKSLDEAYEESLATQETDMDVALAEAMLNEAGFDEFDDASGLLTMNTADLPDFSGEPSEELKMMADNVVKSAREEAEVIVAQAHDEAEHLRAGAYDEAELIKQQAKEEGFQLGYSEGKEAAEQELAMGRNALEQQLNDAEVMFQERKEDLIDTTERNMVDWLCRMIPQITGIVIDSQQDVLLYIINQAMRDLDNSKQFVIRVSSEDFNEVSERKNEIYGARNPNVDLEVFEDAKLSSKQCIIETDNGMVDVSLDVQLDNLIKALRLMIQE